MKYNIIILLIAFFLTHYFYGQGDKYTIAENNVHSTYDCLFKLDDEISKKPSDDQLYHKRSLIYLSLNEYEKALNDINMAINLNSNSDDYYYAKSMIYYFKGYYQNALENITIACNLEKNEKNLYFMSLVYAKMGDYRNAVHTINELLYINPRCDYCYLQKAIWVNKLNMYYEEILNYQYYLAITHDEINRSIISKRIKTLRKDEYFKKLYKAVRSEIKEKGYPWDQ
ncbi:MAG: hypothetical protein N2Z72_02220 [Bacteroidales bacterium]|nr:hypothetical protein [Bacteroidales bacterium]